MVLMIFQLLLFLSNNNQYWGFKKQRGFFGVLGIAIWVNLKECSREEKGVRGLSKLKPQIVRELAGKNYDWFWDFPGGPVAKLPSSQCRGAGLNLIEEPRSHKPGSMANNDDRNNNNNL